MTPAVLDPWRHCKAEAPGWPKGWKIERRPECNRPMGHEGDHWEADSRTFGKRARWPQSEPEAQAHARAEGWGLVSPKARARALEGRKATKARRAR